MSAAPHPVASAVASGAAAAAGATAGSAATPPWVVIHAGWVAARPRPRPCAGAAAGARAGAALFASAKAPACESGARPCPRLAGLAADAAGPAPHPPALAAASPEAAATLLPQPPALPAAAAAGAEVDAAEEAVPFLLVVAEPHPPPPPPPVELAVGPAAFVDVPVPPALLVEAEPHPPPPAPPPPPVEAAADGGERGDATGLTEPPEAAFTPHPDDAAVVDVPVPPALLVEADPHPPPPPPPPPVELATDGGERGDATGLTSVSAGLLSPTSALCATRKACAASFPCFSPTKSFASASVNSTTMSSNVLNPARPMC
jgi:hypothetical protein